METKIDFFSRWPYDDALSWMLSAHSLVKDDQNKVFIGCGSHSERVITRGKDDIKNSLDTVAFSDCLIRPIDRGGGLTAHEPGQLVLYPVFDLKAYGMSVPSLVSSMEMTMISFLAELEIKSDRSEKSHGVFVLGKKIGFVGLRIRDHITSHGLSINVLNDAAIFRRFNPCGIAGLSVTTAHDHAVLSKPLEFYMGLLADHFLKNLWMYLY